MSWLGRSAGLEFWFLSSLLLTVRALCLYPGIGVWRLLNVLTLFLFLVSCVLARRLRQKRFASRKTFSARIYRR